MTAGLKTEKSAFHPRASAAKIFRLMEFTHQLTWPIVYTLVAILIVLSIR